VWVTCIPANGEFKLLGDGILAAAQAAHPLLLAFLRSGGATPIPKRTKVVMPYTRALPTTSLHLAVPVPPAAAAAKAAYVAAQVAAAAAKEAAAPSIFATPPVVVGVPPALLAAVAAVEGGGPPPNAEKITALAVDAWVVVCAAAGKSKEQLAAALAQKVGAAEEGRDAARAALLAAYAAATVERLAHKKAKSAATVEAEAAAAAGAAAVGGEVLVLSTKVVAIGGPVFRPPVDPRGAVRLVVGHYPAKGFDNEGNMDEWLGNHSISLLTAIMRAHAAALGQLEVVPTGGGGGGGGGGGEGGDEAGAAAALPPQSTFPVGTLFTNVVPVLPSDSLNKSSGLKGTAVKLQYANARRTLAAALAAGAAGAGAFSMGVEPASALHYAAAAATLTPTPTDLSPATGRSTILNLTGVVDCLATLLSYATGFESTVRIMELGLGQGSGAGVFLYVGPTLAQLAAALPHASNAAYLARDYTVALYTHADGTPMTRGEKEEAFARKVLVQQQLAVGGVAALQAAAAGGDVDVDSLRNVLGEPMAWKSAEEKLQEYYTLKATGKVVPAAFARANPQLVNAHEDGGASAKGAVCTVVCKSGNVCTCTSKSGCTCARNHDGPHVSGTAKGGA